MPSRAPILIVDDNAANRLAMEEVLRPLDHPVVSLESGEQALAYLATGDAALVVLDVFMPALDGFQTLAKIREIRRLDDVPVVFVSAVYDDAENQARGYALGAVDYLAKPLDSSVLLARFRSLISLHERSEALRRDAAEVAGERAARSERERVLGIVGHELRSPLTTIRSAADLLVARRHLDEVDERMARRIQRNADRMARLISDLLDFTRIQGGPMPIRPAVSDLGELVEEAVGDIRSSISRPIEVSVETHRTVRVDRDRIAQALSNLINNAVQHGANDARVSVALRERDGALELSVWNEGALEADDPSSLFEPFRRGDGSKGVGLGLYITRQIALAHGGDVSVSSSAASGTTFRLTLPLSPAGV